MACSCCAFGATADEHFNGDTVTKELAQYRRKGPGPTTRRCATDFTKDLCSSYPSVRDTLTHIVSGEWIWLQRWKGTSPRQMFDPEEFPELEPLRVRWAEFSADQRTFLGAVTGEQLRAVLAYVNLRGQTWRYPLWRQMYHVVNHSSYHRGQLTTMLRQLKAVPVPTDFLVFHDELAPLSDGT